MKHRLNKREWRAKNGKIIKYVYDGVIWSVYMGKRGEPAELAKHFEFKGRAEALVDYLVKEHQAEEIEVK